MGIPEPDHHCGGVHVGVGILITIVNFLWSNKHGPLAGKNPWRADSLEWSTDSPPAPYGSVHIPTVTSRHPLWDDHDEEADQDGERILDEGRLTMITTPLDAQPVAIARIAKDTIKPLLAALGLFVICGALAFRMMWVVWPTVLYTMIVLALWLRPNPETENA